MARGGNHFIISVAPLELSQGIWKANSRRQVELSGLMNRWHRSRCLLPFPEPLHQLGAEAQNYPKDGGLGRGEGDCSPWAICSPFSLRACIDQDGIKAIASITPCSSVLITGAGLLWAPRNVCGAGKEWEGEAHGWGENGLLFSWKWNRIKNFIFK